MLDLYSAREMSDPLVFAGGPDAPHVIALALQYFDRCLAAIRAFESECAEARRRAREQL